MISECGMCQRASLFKGLPPTDVNPPPRNNSEPVQKMANNPLSPIPLPSDDHAVPFHLEMPLAVTPPMEMKVPPTYASVPEIAAATIDPAPFTPPCNDSQ